MKFPYEEGRKLFVIFFYSGRPKTGPCTPDVASPVQNRESLP